MKKAMLIPAATMLAMAAMTISGAPGAIAADPGIYGRIDTGRFPKPKTFNSRPMVASPPAKRSRAKPIYLHVMPGQQTHWHASCQTYDACSVPVYFVTEGWFLNVYLPAIGAQDGREQRYRIQMGRERDVVRDTHNMHGEEE